MVATHQVHAREHKLFYGLELRATATEPPVRAAASAAVPSPSPTYIYKLPSSVVAVASVTSVIGALVITSLG
jgi:hypothetical protein